MLANARQARLNAEWHKNLAIPGGRCGSATRRDGVVPKPIKVLPRVALHYWAWIFSPHVVYVDVFCPFGLDSVAHRSILGISRCNCNSRQCQCQNQSLKI